MKVWQVENQARLQRPKKKGGRRRTKKKERRTNEKDEAKRGVERRKGEMGWKVRVISDRLLAVSEIERETLVWTDATATIATELICFDVRHVLNPIPHPQSKYQFTKYLSQHSSQPAVSQQPV